MTAVLATQILCAVLFGSLAAFAAFRWRQPCGYGLAAACAITSLWALAAGIEIESSSINLQIVMFMDTLGCAAWVLFAAGAYANGLHQIEKRRRVGFIAAAIGIVAIILSVYRALFNLLPEPMSSHLGFSILIYGHLALVTGGGVFIEALIYRASPEARWRLKYVCLGIATILGYDFFYLAEALLYGRFNPDLGHAKAIVFSLAAPVIAAAIWRHRRWYVEFTTGRRAIVQSAVLVSIGVVLLSVSSGAAFLSATQGPDGLMVRVMLLAAFGSVTAVLAVSGASRSYLRGRLRRIFLAPRYDYRREWQRFVHNLSSLARGATLRERALRAVADLADSPRSALWLRENDTLSQVMRIGFPVVRENLEPEDPFFLSLCNAEPRVVLLDGSGRPGNGISPVPDSLSGLPGAWLLVALIHRERLIGFLVLGKPRIPRRITDEDEELLQTVTKQVASYLAEEQATRALEEANRFRELSRSLSFQAHDLRNLANDLSLSLANARRHIDNPKFHPDLLASMDDTVAGMHRLLTLIAKPNEKEAEIAAQSVDLAELVSHFAISRPLEGPDLAIEIETDEPCWVAGDRDKLQAIMGHLIRNALDAADHSGRVGVRLSRDGEKLNLEVTDDGPGMSQELLHDRLHHPFQSTKETGFGIGMYECREVALALGGSLVMASEVGRGTMARLCLPVVEPKASEGDRLAHAG